MQFHYDALGKGVIDLRDVLYFLSLTTLFIYATYWVLKLRRWNS
jgi:ABC-2 type transport system permease protein